MALYAYDCPGCGRTFEKRVPMAEADKTTCPHCGNHHPKRLLSRISVAGQSGRSEGAPSPAPVGGG